MIKTRVGKLVKVKNQDRRRQLIILIKAVIFK